MSGRGGALFIAGEPGIGKSRLAEEALAHAERQGVRALWGTCWEGGGAPPCWPWIQVIRHLAADVPPSDVPAEVTTMMGGSPPPGEGKEAPSDPGQARFQLFDGVASIVRRAVERGPLAVVLDDLQWADPSSLLLLRFLVQDVVRLPVLVLGTYRDVEVGPDHPLAQAISDLGGSAATLPLGGLDVDGVRRLAEAIRGSDPGAALAAELHSATGGNPFYVGELVRLRAEERPGEASAVPATIADAIQRRRAQLSAACDRVLQTASVLGLEFDLGVLEAFGRGEEADPAPAVAEAVAARLVVEGDTPGRRRFAHDLVRQAFYRSLSSKDRARMHRRAAEVLTERGGDPVEEIAHHMFRALPDVDASLAVEALERAARAAIGRRAYDEAVMYRERALDVEGTINPRDAGRTCDLLLGLGDAQYRAGRVGEARRSFLRAGDEARTNDWPERLSRSAMGFQSLGTYVAVPDDELIDLLEAAVRAHPERDVMRAKLLARLSWELYLSDLERSRRLAREAVETARLTGDAEAIATALSNLYYSVAGIADAEERRGISSELRALAEGTGRFDLELWGRIWHVVDLLEVGDVNGVDREIEAMNRLADRYRAPYFLWWPAIWRAMRALLDGRFEEAGRLAQHALEVGREAHGEKAQMYHGVQVMLLLAEQGRLDEVEAGARAAVELRPTLPVYRCRLALAHAELGREAEARAGLDRLAADGFAGLQRDWMWGISMAMLSETCALLNDAPRAGELYELLRPLEGTTITVGFASLSRGPVDRYLGLLATAMERWDEAVAHFEASLELCTRMGARPWAAHTRHDLARMLAARAAPGDADRAGGLVEEVIAEGDSMGMIWLGSRAEELAERLGRVEVPPGDAIFRLDGDVWSIAFQGKAFRLRDAKGLRDMAQLLARPGREVHVLDLVAAAERHAPALAAAPEDGLGVPSTGDAPLDERARAQYQSRIVQLQHDLDEAERSGDAGGVATARAELDFLAAELATAYGLGGRPRKPGDPVERARKAVTTRIRYSLNRIEREHRELGRHLERSIRTGTFCSYEPERPVDWTF